MTANGTIDCCGVVIKMDVSDVGASVRWYTSVLGCLDPSFQTHDFAQLALPGRDGVHLGLFLNPGNLGSKGQVTTFLVSNIEAAILLLEAHGISIGPKTWPGLGVCVVEFADPDGNRLAVRQNPAR